MRTTIELPDSILKQAKIAAIERGTTLKDLIGEALAKELGLSGLPSIQRKRIQFPLVESKNPGSLHLTSADLDEVEAEEDRRRHGLPD